MLLHVFTLLAAIHTVNRNCADIVIAPKDTAASNEEVQTSKTKITHPHPFSQPTPSEIALADLIFQFRLSENGAKNQFVA